MTDARRIDLPTREWWLHHRRIGSSDVAPVLGLPCTGDRSAWDVQERLVRGVVRDPRPTPDQLRGRRLEREGLRRYKAEHDVPDLVVPREHTLWQRGDWATATPDAARRLARWVVEVKTDRRPWRWGPEQTIERWEPWVGEVVPLEYYLQVAHQLYVLDFNEADLVVLLPSAEDPFAEPELRVYHLLRDRELEARLVHRLSSWWERHVVARERLPPDGSEAAQRFYAFEHAGRRKATPAESAMAHYYELAKRNAKHWEEQRRLAGQALLAAANGKKRLDLPDGHVTIVIGKRLYLNTPELLEQFPEYSELLASYTEETDYAYALVRIKETR